MQTATKFFFGCRTRWSSEKKELEVVVCDVGMDELLALAAHDADNHQPGVEIDSAMVFGGGRVILHAVIRWGVRWDTG